MDSRVHGWRLGHPMASRSRMPSRRQDISTHSSPIRACFHAASRPVERTELTRCNERRLDALRTYGIVCRAATSVLSLPLLRTPRLPRPSRSLACTAPSRALARPALERLLLCRNAVACRPPSTTSGTVAVAAAASCVPAITASDASATSCDASSDVVLRAGAIRKPAPSRQGVVWVPSQPTLGIDCEAVCAAASWSERAENASTAADPSPACRCRCCACSMCPTASRSEPRTTVTLSLRLSLPLLSLLPLLQLLPLLLLLLLPPWSSRSESC